MPNIHLAIFGVWNLSAEYDEANVSEFLINIVNI